MREKIGEKKVFEFRRSWDIKPDALSRESPYHPINIETYNKICLLYTSPSPRDQA